MVAPMWMDALSSAAVSTWKLVIPESLPLDNRSPSTATRSVRYWLRGWCVENTRLRGAVNLHNRFVNDFVGVALFGEETLSVLRKVLLDGVTGDNRVKHGGPAVRLGAKDPPETLRLFLA